jgi:hypothetical protein
MTINLIHQKTVSGRKVKNLREIINFYLKHGFHIDSVNILAVIVSIATKLYVFNFLRLVIIWKFPQIL